MSTEVLTATTQSAGKYLTVQVAGEAYGVAVLKVREIIRLQKMTPVAQMPAHVRGVINLRGRVIPVIDLRAKFGLEAKMDERTCIVVIQVRRDDGAEMPFGIVVDRVEEVVNVAAGDIEPPPEFGSAVLDQTQLIGMAKIKGQVVTLLDIDRAITR